VRGDSPAEEVGEEGNGETAQEQEGSWQMSTPRHVTITIGAVVLALTLLVFILAAILGVR
jgi:hypothetical protein